MPPMSTAAILTHETDVAANEPASDWLRERKIIVIGKLSGMRQREFRRLLAKHDATQVRPNDESTTLVIVSDDQWPREPGIPPHFVLDEPARRLVRQGAAEIIAESALWERLGLVETAPDVRQLYTAAMLGSLLGISPASVRSWQRQGLLSPVCMVRKLAYFDFVQATSARRIATLVAERVSIQAILRSTLQLAKRFPTVAFPLGELPLVVAGRQLLVRQGDGLVDIAGQYRIDFDAVDLTSDESSPPCREQNPEPRPNILSPAAFHRDAPAATPEELLAAAAELEEQGNLPAAADACRAAMMAGGPSAETCFTLAELLYRQGDTAAARERYCMAIELDEDFVEARANLGCLLAETGQLELAVAALEGALECHLDYADAHYHLARTLDALDRRDEAITHWRRFADLAPESPWAEEANLRLHATNA
jgi:tetratricopeptide (TPR) repeat protein